MQNILGEIFLFILPTLYICVIFPKMLHYNVIWVCYIMLYYNNNIV